MEREEAIKVVRNIYQTDAEKEALETLIPELRQSEDERIRAVILKLMLGMRGEIFTAQDELVTKPKVLAWLEKQKEQKPAEWDEYTKTNLDRALQIIKKAKGTLQGYQSDDGIYECDKAIETIELILQNGIETRKPTEWSEEDEDMLNSCISSIEEAKENRYAYKETDGDTSYDHEIAWLKSLRPVSKDSLQSWKPCEDEERLINTSISFLKDFADKGYENAVECIDWLKSKLSGNSGK